MKQAKRFLLSVLTLLLCTIMYAQQEITGTVTDAMGPVIGATAKDGMTVTMQEDALSLNEVVVTGYTTQRKADLTGAVSVVSVSELQKQNENNPMKALQGRVPGMNISADGNLAGAATVRIRGIGTLNDNDPLYIIDGVPTKAGMHELNGNDIESIQVLKDAASASIYGSRAANGVIIITTKKGKDGKVVIGENFSVNRTKGTDAPGGILENALEFNPNFPIYAENGEFAQALGAYSERENPLSLIYNNKDNEYTQWRMFGDAHVSITPFKNFTVRSTLGMDYSQKQQRFFTYPIANGKMKRTDTAAESKQEHWMRWMWNAIATYNLEIGQHRADAMIGMEVNRQDYNWNSAKRYELSILNTDYMWPSAGTGKQLAEGSGEGFSLVSFFGKANYTYADRYMASLTIRRDGSSRFGSNNQYGTFPSVSVGWRITQENFMRKTSSWLDDLKLRYSWGQTGNQEISNTARYTLYRAVVSTGLWESGAAGSTYDITGSNGGYILDNGYVRSQRGNDDIKWETTTQHNIGLDFALLRNELYGSFDWFHKKTSDILLFMDGIASMGEGASQWINAGEVKNTGWEFSLGYRHKLANGLSWDINGNISRYTNEITRLPETVAANGRFGGNGVKSVIGHPMFAQVGYVADGIFKSQEEIDNHATQEGAGLGRIRWKDLNGDGKITEADQDWIYDPTPDFTWGLNIYLQYKDFDFTMFWQGVQGVDVDCRGFKSQTDFWANSNINVPYLNKGVRTLDAWSPANPGSDIPALTTADRNNEGRVSSYYIENGSFAKLRTIQLGYNLPKTFTDKLRLDRLRLYLSAQNLLTIKSGKFSGVDPENPGFNYPIPLNLTFGLNVSF